MSQTAGDLSPGRREGAVAIAVFALLLVFHLWAVTRNWASTDLPGNGFRQTQTALTAMFVQKEHNFSLAYPTPVLGKPWSIPFEFPLYQWTAVAVSDVTGLPVIEAGRAVSAMCLYLCLPALWVLLGYIGMPRVVRWLTLGLVLICPLYIFYARAFLIETMALMFSLWFLVAFISAVERRSVSWLLLANLAGAGAGLVKITTWMVYLIPAGLLTLRWILQAWKQNGSIAGAKILGWVAAATAVPFALTFAWLRFADATKALNPSSRNLVSSAMHGYNFGTWESRTSPEIWSAHARVIVTNVMPLTALIVAAVLMFLAGARWRKWIVGAVAVFAIAPLMFPVLYAWHEYYWVASSVLLLVAVGMAMAGARERLRQRGWVLLLLFGVIVGFELRTYFVTLYPFQVDVQVAGTPMAKALKAVTRPDGVVIVVGEDWGSMTPFYSRRRALMIRRNMENDIPYLREAFGLLKDEHVVALVVRGAQRENQRLANLLREYFDFPREYDFRWEDADIFLRPADRNLAMAHLREMQLEALQLSDNPNPPTSYFGREIDVANLPPTTLEAFAGMTPKPDRVFMTFSLSSNTEFGRRFFDAHPDTRLWFTVPPGRHEITTEFAIREGAYAGVAESDATDGVEFTIYEVMDDGDLRIIYDRVLTPFSRAEDRGLQAVKLQTEISPGSRIVFQTSPQKSYQRDWAMWGPITIK